jgi:hypothetical protein
MVITKRDHAQHTLIREFLDVERSLDPSIRKQQLGPALLSLGNNCARLVARSETTHNHIKYRIIQATFHSMHPNLEETKWEQFAPKCLRKQHEINRKIKGSRRRECAADGPR